MPVSKNRKNHKQKAKAYKQLKEEHGKAWNKMMMKKIMQAQEDAK
jgi:hypothetical protein